MVACEGALRLQRPILEYSEELGHWDGTYDDSMAYSQGKFFYSFDIVLDGL
jgi:hypothetical protein